ncbi:MAG: DUF4173 domain-containing protein, partial [Acidimicrobiia bacterium]
AEYARQGFFQLVAVAVLTLLVIAAVIRFGSRREDRHWLRGLLGMLCLLTIVILFSASTRMNLYQEAYGFTRLRLLVDLANLWLGAIFCLLIVAGISWRAAWLPRAVVLVSIVAVVGFGIYDPDARIAERNIERFRATGEIDLAYLSGLSTDALPHLLGLPEPHRSCAIGPIVARSRSSSPWSFNLSRNVATEVADEIDGTEPPCNF